MGGHVATADGEHSWSTEGCQVPCRTPTMHLLRERPQRPTVRGRRREAQDVAQIEAVADTGIKAIVDPPIRTRCMAFMNQKGGVGKTTTTVNVAAALAERGERVLLIDLDPQAHLTLHLAAAPEAGRPSLYHLLTDDAVTFDQVVRPCAADLDLLPAEVNLAGVETELAPKMITGHAQRVLRSKCAASLDADADNGNASRGYRYVLIDCPPSLGLLTVNALTLAREVIVPMQAQFLALQGLSKLLETVGMIRQSFNPELIVSGVVVCMHERQTILAAEVLSDLDAFLTAARDQDVPWKDAEVLAPPIRRNIKLAECPGFGSTIFDYAPQSHGAEDYRQLASSIAALTVGR